MKEDGKGDVASGCVPDLSKPINPPKKKKNHWGGYGKKISRIKKEAIFQMYIKIGNKKALARRLGITVPTISRIIREMESDPMLAQIRARALEEASARAMRLADRIIASIGDEELKTEHHLVRNKYGEISGGFTSGPGLRDKALAAGILMDKGLAISQETVRLRGKQGYSGGLILPEDLKAAEETLKAKLTRLNVQVEFTRDGAVVTREGQPLDSRPSSGLPGPSSGPSGPSSGPSEALDAEFEVLGGDNSGKLEEELGENGGDKVFDMSYFDPEPEK